MTNQEKNKLCKYWLDSSKEDWKTFFSLKKAKRYAPALFFLHLTLEKKIKAVIVKKTKAHAPYSHNLQYLFGKADIEVPEQILSILNVISEFNMEARYPDEKLVFYKKANKEFTEKWHKEAVKILQILEAELKAK